MQFDGRTIIVTGASSGIGAGIARDLGARGVEDHGVRVGGEAGGLAGAGQEVQGAVLHLDVAAGGELLTAPLPLRTQPNHLHAAAITHPSPLSRSGALAVRRRHQTRRLAAPCPRCAAP